MSVPRQNEKSHVVSYSPSTGISTCGQVVVVVALTVAAIVIVIAMVAVECECIRTCLVAASDKLRSVHKQFWIRRWLEPVRCWPKACIPPVYRCKDTVTYNTLIYTQCSTFIFRDVDIPASTIAGLLLGQTESTLRTRLVVHRSFS